MKILIVGAGGHWPEVVSGQMIGQHELALDLAARGHQAIVLTGGRSAPAHVAPSEDAELGYARWRAADAVAALPFAIRITAPDIVVLMSHPALPRMMVACHELAVPTLVYLRNAETRELEGRLLPDPFFRYLAVSEFAARRWRAWSGITCAVLPAAVDPARHAVARGGDAVTFVNPVPKKGVTIAMALAAALRSARFIVTESWMLPEAYRDHLRARGQASGNIEWRGRADDMRPIWAETRVLLVPSAWEDAAPRVIREAQHSGIPTLGSDRGGIPELVGAGGEIVPLHAPIERWVGALRRMLADPAHHARLSDEARALAARPDLAPAKLLDRFLLIAREHIAAIKG